MPFDRNGIWQPPTPKDVENFNAKISEQDEVQVAPTAELINALTKGAAVAETASSNLDFFKNISRLKGPADIIIPVYGGLQVLKTCIDSIRSRTSWPHRLILVDDASPDKEIQRYLKTLDRHPDFSGENYKKLLLLTNSKNRGFAGTVNRGVEAGINPYVVILNSDVIVSESWLTKMLMALEADERNVIVNPLTNNTAMINVNMYPGKNYLDMTKALDRIKNIRYPEAMPTGFCYMFRRQLWNEIGPFDEAFGSYGEESSYWFKAIHHTNEEGTLLNNRAIIADNCYMFHERGTSFSQLGEAAHGKQRNAGNARFHQLHPEFGEWVKGYNVDNAVGHLRANIPLEAFASKYKGNVAWLVKSAAPCGGMSFITDIANKLIEENYNVKICIIPDDPTTKLGVTANLRCRPIMFKNQQEFVDNFTKQIFDHGIILSAVTELTECGYALSQAFPGIQAYNHVQSWDIELVKYVGREELTPNIKNAYLQLPNIVSSKWVAEEIEKLGGEVKNIIPPGLDPDIFHPKDYRKTYDDRPTLSILLMNNYPFKGFERGLEFCDAVRLEAKNQGLDLRILGLGIDSVPDRPWIIGKGALSQTAISDILANETDLFVDPSHVHSYGLPILEALFSGTKALCWENKGVHEYRHYYNKTDLTVIDNEKDMVFAARHAIDRLKGQASFSSPQEPKLYRGIAVNKFIKELFSEEIKPKKRYIEVVTPHLRKHGGPTTNIALTQQIREIGHDITMSIVYTDWNPEVFNGAICPIRTKWEKVPAKTEVVIINSDNPFAAEIMKNNPGQKYIMYKLSHNERFKQTENDNLNLSWDHIMTSTKWLKDACCKPKEGWTHQAWKPKNVTVVGWYHYGHPIFNCPPQNRTYGSAEVGFRVGTLIHGHPLKGTEVALGIIDGLKRKWEGSMHTVGFGENKAKLPKYFQYIRAADRGNMAHIMKQLDIWLGASYTEGLGRMSLEAMSAGVPVVTTDTGAEFLKNKENCLLYKPGEAQEAAELIDALIQDQESMRTLIIAGYKTATKAADPTKFRLNVKRVIEKVLNEE